MIHYCVHGRVPPRFSVQTLPRIARACSQLKKAVQSGIYEVSISFVSARKIQDLNRTYRKINAPTDVLSFNSGLNQRLPAPRALRPAPHDFGDLFICASYTIAHAKEVNEIAERELIRMVVHGTLHIMGFDHGTKKDEKRMFEIQERIVGSVYPGPSAASRRSGRRTTDDERTSYL